MLPFLCPLVFYSNRPKASVPKGLRCLEMDPDYLKGAIISSFLSFVFLYIGGLLSFSCVCFCLLKGTCANVFSSYYMYIGIIYYADVLVLCLTLFVSFLPSDLRTYVSKGVCDAEPGSNTECKTYANFREKYHKACEGDYSDATAEITCADEDAELNDTPTGLKVYNPDTRETTLTRPTPYYWWIRIEV